MKRIWDYWSKWFKPGNTGAVESGDGPTAVKREDKSVSTGKRLPTIPRVDAVIGKRQVVSQEDYKVAVNECHKAMKEWNDALRRLDWVVEPDQVDYAIYSVIAAEKHYTSLLKETKRMHRLLASS